MNSRGGSRRSFMNSRGGVVGEVLSIRGGGGSRRSFMNSRGGVVGEVLSIRRSRFDVFKRGIRSIEKGGFEFQREVVNSTSSKGNSIKKGGFDPKRGFDRTTRTPPKYGPDDDDIYNSNNQYL